MKLKYITMVLVVLLTLAFTMGTGAANTNSQTTASDDVKEYNGPIGADHPLYGLKLAFEDMDEAFTFNQNDKLTKKLTHLDERIAEYKAAESKKNMNAANKVLEKYEEKIKDIESISDSSSSGKNTGLLNAVLRIKKHQFILENLTNRDPDNAGLKIAYENSKEHWQNFAIKHHIDIENLTIEDEEHETLTDSVKIRAKITSKGNTAVEIEMKFGSSNVTNTTLAKEIRNKFLALSKQNIAQLIKIENTSEEEELQSELEAKADIKKEGTKVEVEYKFPVNENDKDKIVDAIVAKLTSITDQNILDVLKIESEDHKEVTASQKEIKNEGREINREIDREINREEKKGKQHNDRED